MAARRNSAVFARFARLLTLATVIGLLSAAQPLAAQPAVEPPPETAAVLAAHSPQNAVDLRMIQAQLQRVIKQTLPATVGVEVHNAAGSGVIVSKDGLVLTAAHVIGKSGRRASVNLPDGRVLKAHTLGANHDLDAGMMKIDNPPEDLPYAPVSEGAELANGEWVVTIGQPGGVIEHRSPPVRLGRILFRGDGILCTDCKLVGGDSGGPLFNMKGEVVGIHSSIGPQLTHNFHVPVSAFRKSWRRLLAGEVWGTEHEDDENGARLGVSGHTENGKCVITEVFEGSAAEKAGLKTGDVILAVENRPITTFDELKRIVFFKRPGAKMRMTVGRGNQTLQMTAELTGGQ